MAFFSQAIHCSGGYVNDLLRRSLHRRITILLPSVATSYSASRADTRATLFSVARTGDSFFRLLCQGLIIRPFTPAPGFPVAEASDPLFSHQSRWFVFFSRRLVLPLLAPATHWPVACPAHSSFHFLRQQ